MVYSLAYASWRGGGIDLLAVDPASNKPDHVYEIDWNDAYASPDNSPAVLRAFVEGTNRKANPYILTRTQARPASMGGIDITLVPLSLYAYWLERDPTLGRFHGGGGA